MDVPLLEHLTHRASAPGPATARDVAARPVWTWLLTGTVLFFLVPFVGTDVLGLQPDLYYLLYFTVAILWFTVFVATYRTALVPLWRSHLGGSLVVGAVTGAALVGLVLSETGTGHAEGWRFWFEIAWRGVTYGAIDAITLFVFPAAVAFLLMHGDRTGARRKTGFAGLALGLTLLVTTSYHLGYEEYRDQTMRNPLVGATVASVPTVLTGNPVGAVVAHTSMHVTAVVHQRNGGRAHMLPPEMTPAYPDRGDGDIAAALATVWMIGVAGAFTLAGGPARRRSGAGRG